MLIDSSILKNEESVIYKLRGLYRKHGYSFFKMSKFEEYDLYGQNKDFLVSEGIITFTDTNGKLMALKPDVTLSIVKNHRPAPSIVQRVYYNENVYRIKDKSSGYREIMQTGLECLGDLSEYNITEVLLLAAESLKTISDISILNISHLGILSAIISQTNITSDKEALIQCINSKNINDIKRLCVKNNVSDGIYNLFAIICELNNTPFELIKKIKNATDDEEILRSLLNLQKIYETIGEKTDIKINIDLSIVSDMNYYNGIVFQGYIKGLPSVILSGGQYDSLMKKMGKDSGGIGFAVYLDQLEIMDSITEYDTDVVLLCSKDVESKIILDKVDEIIAGGETVMVQRDIPGKIRYKRIEYLK